MNKSSHYILGVSLAALLVAGPSGARADATTQIGNATVTVGVGTAILTLPDIEFTKRYALVAGLPFLNSERDSKNFGDEIGWNIEGSIAVPMTGAQGRPKWLTLSGFWANIEDDDRTTCSATAGSLCAWNNIIDPPGNTLLVIANTGETATVRSSREVDHWGLSLESKWMLTPEVMGVTRAPNARYVALGVDLRGIDQEIALRTRRETVPNSDATYDEDLDTRYYGVYAAWGGDYSPWILRNFWERHGLQSSFMLRGGVYYADTDYDGRFSAPVLGSFGQLSLSSDDAAFIGGIVLETRKKIGARTTLSLKSEYEYYSYVPEMRYNDLDDALNGPTTLTHITDDDAFSARTMLRLTVSLGGHPEPVK